MADGTGAWSRAGAGRQQDAYYAYYSGAQEVTPSEYGEGAGGLAGVGAGAAAAGVASRASHGQGAVGSPGQGHGAAAAAGEGRQVPAPQGHHLAHDYQSPSRPGGPGGPGAGLAAWAEEEDPYGGIAGEEHPSPQPAVGTGHSRSQSSGSSRQRSQYSTTSPRVPVPHFTPSDAPPLPAPVPVPVPASLQPGGGARPNAPTPASHPAASAAGYQLPGLQHEPLQAPGDGRFGDHGPAGPVPGASPAPSHRSISALAAWSGSGAMSDEMDRPRQGPLRVVNSDEGDHN